MAGTALPAVASGPAGAATSAPSWTAVASSPIAQDTTGSAMAYDPATGQLVDYDANGFPAPLTSTWDGARWTVHQQVAPPALSLGASLAYDPASQRVIMVGELIINTAVTEQMWAWNGSVWTQLPTPDPSASPAPGCMTAGSTGEIFAYNPSDASEGTAATSSHTWAWTNGGWAQLAPAASPPAGICLGMTYDAARHLVVMTFEPESGTALQTWLWDGATWSQAATLPAPMGGDRSWTAPVSFDPDSGTDLTYLGDTNCTSISPAHGFVCQQTDQLWSFDGSSWTQAPATGAPQAGNDFAAAYDAATHQYVLVPGIVWISGSGSVHNGTTYVHAAPGSSSATPVRVFGADRQSTAVAASKLAFPTAGSASAVVLARADLFADALAGGPLAAAKHAPLLLTSTNTLDSVTADEIKRVLPAGDAVYLLGGTSALSDAVANAVTALGGVPVRVFGADRFGTAVAVADAMGDPSTVFEASGTNFPDALSAVPAAIAQHAAILLTNGSAQASATAQYLTAHASARYAVGGPAAWADPTAIGIAGADRYATSQSVALAFFPDAKGVALASGATFPDALAAGPVAGASAEPVLLVPSSGALPEPITAYLSTHAGLISAVHAYGGASAVNDTVLAEVASALK
ncbi:MAG TPA: cell wall-binding repeat-containing protein [Acidothermaceae bacterium]